MKTIDPLKHESLSDLIRVSISGRKKRENARGGLYSKGAKRSYVREPITRHRRVIVKAVILENNGEKWQERRRKHAEYLQRDGTSIDGKKGVAYGRDDFDLDVSEFLERSKDDPRGFRFIVSPEDAGEIDLSTFTRNLIKRMEDALGTKLDWMAVNHYNTDQPHTHITLRGVDDMGNGLVLDKDFISNGIRNLAREIITRELGERSDLEIRKEIEDSISKRRVSQLDLSLERLAGESRVFALSSDLHLYDIHVEVRDQVRRLEFLQELGLVQRVNKTSWHLDPDMITKLREMGFQGDIIKMMHREAKGIEDKECTIFKTEIHAAEGVRGIVLARGISNELRDREYIVVESPDGKAYYVDLDFGCEKKSVAVGDEVKIGLREPYRIFKKFDDIIIQAALENGGIYDPKQHLESIKTFMWFPTEQAESGPTEYLAKHVSRLERFEKLGLATKLEDERWQMESDILEKMEILQKNHEVDQKPRIQIDIVDLSVDELGQTRRWKDRDCIIYKQEIHGLSPLKGTLLARGVSSQGKDYVVVHAINKNDYYIEIGKFTEGKQKGRVGDELIVEMSKAQHFLKNSDRNIARFAKINRDIYDVDAHVQWAKANLKIPADKQTDSFWKEYGESHSLRMNFIERFKLVTKLGEKQWQVDPEMIPKMESLKKEHEDKLKSKLQIRLTDIDAEEWGDKRPLEGKEYPIVNVERHSGKRFEGTVVGRGIANRRAGKEYLLIRRKDGEEHYLEMPRYSEDRNKRAIVGDVVSVGCKEGQRFQKKSDANIMAIAKANGDIYDAKDHLNQVKRSSKLPKEHRNEKGWKDYIDKHVLRMNFLEAHKLTTRIDDGRWHVEPEMEAKMVVLQKELEEKLKPRPDVRIIGHDHEVSGQMKVVRGRQCIVFDKTKHAENGLEGVIKARGISDNKANKPYVVVQTKSGKNYYLDISVRDNNRVRINDSVKISLNEAQRFFKKSDTTIAEFAAMHGNVYRADAHLDWAQTNLGFTTARAEAAERNFVERHVARMNFLEKFDLVKPTGYREWAVAPDFLEKMKDAQAKHEPNFIRELKIDVISKGATTVDDNFELKGTQQEVHEARELGRPNVETVDIDTSENGRKKLVEGKEYAVVKNDMIGNDEIAMTVVGRGVANEADGRDYLLLKASYGKEYYLELFRQSEAEKSRALVGDKVLIRMIEAQRFGKKSDYNISKMASENGDVYDSMKHLELIKTKSRFSEDKVSDEVREQYIHAHMTRMNFLERYELVKPMGEGKWAVVPDLLKKMEPLQKEHGHSFKPRLQLEVIRGQSAQLKLQSSQEAPSKGMKL